MEKTSINKRARTVNFSREETERLISLVEKFKLILENKKSDSITWQDKEKAWKAIESEFNCAGAGPFRDCKQLKLKFVALKRETRKRSSLFRAEQYKTGGGKNLAPPLTAVQQKVKEMILLSVEGNESLYDSDQLDAVATVTDVPEKCIVLQESTDQTENVVGVDGVVIETDTADAPYHPTVIDPMPSTSSQVEVDIDIPLKNWAKWKPASLKSRKHPALCKPKEKRPFDRLAEEKIKITEMQKQLLQEEFKEKALKRDMMLKKMDMMSKKMDYERELFKLEQEERMLRIEILNVDLEIKKKV